MSLSRHSEKHPCLSRETRVFLYFRGVTNLSSTYQTYHFAFIIASIVHRFDICTTSMVDYVVLEAMDNSTLPGSHSSIWSLPEYGHLGGFTSRRLPAELEALKPMSKERSEKVGAWLDDLKQQAKAYVLAAFPQDFAAA